jgi:hypothetical protein
MVEAGIQPQSPAGVGATETPQRRPESTWRHRVTQPATYTAYPYTDAFELLEAAGLGEKTISRILGTLPEGSVRALTALGTTGAPRDVVTWLASLPVDTFARTLDMSTGNDAVVVREHLRVAL